MYGGCEEGGVSSRSGIDVAIGFLNQTASRCGISPLEFETDAGPRSVRPQRAIHGAKHAVEELLLDAHVVVEIFQVAHPRHGAAHMGMDAGRSVRRERQAEGVREHAGPEEPGDAAASRGVGLKHVDAARLEHPPEVLEVVAVLPGGDLHAGRRAVAEQSQPVEVVGRDRLFEPGDVLLRELLRLREGMLPIVGAVGVDEELGGVTDRGPRRSTRTRSAAASRPIFIFTRGSHPEPTPRAARRASQCEYEVKPPLP